jgi:exopolysaccharide biosynthesis polyprenyl glycosylphosphotransferase
VLACASHNLYRTHRELTASAETLRVVRAVALATAVLILFIFTSGNKEISRLVLACAGAVNIVTLSGWRFAKRQYVLRRADRGTGLSRVLIVGAGKMGHAFADWIANNPRLGYAVCGFLDAHPNGDARVLGSISDFRRVALAQFADEVFITPPADREVVKQIFIEARQLHLDLHVLPDLYDGLGWHAPLHTIGGFPVLRLHGEPIPGLGLAVKRVVDVLASAIGLVVLAPILVAAAIWIRLDSAGPAVYAAPRVGKKGKTFHCYKLRTMVANADGKKQELRNANERHGPFFKMEGDPRVTRCGRWLRKFSMDELPQLVNVLRGEMSLVGPRPHPLDDYERYTIEHLRRLDIKPGITGLWQVTARRDPSFERNMELDLDYIEHWSLWLDLRILVRTLPEVLKANGR